ncbi:MAG TPA: hypothetical protein VGI39_06975 [Polyangiaceae bacterium]|jgi:hypothetical protein
MQRGHSIEFLLLMLECLPKADRQILIDGRIEAFRRARSSARRERAARARGRRWGLFLSPSANDNVMPWGAVAP